MTSPRWMKHLMGCQRKGREACERGEPKNSCPYAAASSYGTGGKNLTRQRTGYWLFGWESATRVPAKLKGETT